MYESRLLMLFTCLVNATRFNDNVICFDSGAFLFLLRLGRTNQEEITKKILKFEL